jgi:hypothetical protein
MIARSLKAKVLVLAVFFTGIATGVLIMNYYETRVTGARNNADRTTRAERAQREVDRMSNYLGLTEDQRAQVNQILESTRTEFRELQKQTRPQFDAIQEGSRTKIRAILSDTQRQKYDEFIATQSGRRRRN